ncbi:hypothetical protein [Arenimonas sp. GDDSR-1]|uniref:hypothetical protein n=1 Tax=Arenimonas sp. GDDSR-1 TaxID=2950125 RepID=UPI0026378446|nr:hypothetical protein [Arenimonas sp. GDDSR-1]
MIARSMRYLLLAAAVALLAACASSGGRLQKAGTAADVYGMAIHTDLNWSRIKLPRQELWTIDGPGLNSLNIIPDTKPGEHVFHLAKERKSRPDGPWFRAGMRPDELRDVILDAIREQGWADVDSSNFRPHTFSDTAGIRFDVRQTSPEGLRYLGSVGAFERGGRLTVLYWKAPEEYYYGRDAQAVNRLIDAIGFIPE